MMQTVIFGMTFFLGPALFWLLARRQAASWYFSTLCALAVLLMSVALMLPALFEPSSAVTILRLLLLWIGWVLVLSLCALALRSRLPHRQARKTAFAVCAMATTLPWFGLYAAQMMSR